MSELLKHLPISKTIRANLSIYDPSNQWRDVASCLPSLDLKYATIKEHITESGTIIRATFLKGNFGNVSDVLLVLVPEKGFEKEQADCLRDYLGHSDETKLLLFAFADEEGLAEDNFTRDQPGFLTLSEEIEREFREPLFIIPRDGFSEISSNFMDKVQSLCQVHGHLNACRRSNELLVKFSSRYTEYRRERLKSLNELTSVFLDSKKAQLLHDTLHSVRSITDIAHHNISVSRENWRDICQSGKDICSTRASKSKYGSIWADKISFNANGLQAIIDHLDKNWSAPPIEELTQWREEANDILQTSDIILPIVGVFSCGKTTLINKLLGVTKKGRQFFRTSITHNTALLSHFHYAKSGDQNKVVFKWRKSLTGIALVTSYEYLGKEARIHSQNLIKVFPKAIRSFKEFIDQKKLANVEIEIRRYKAKKDVILRGHKIVPVINELIEMVGDSEAETESYRVKELTASNPIVMASISCDVATKSERIESHALETDEDWDWYQGSVSHDKKGKSKRKLGFAESSEAEFLIAKCDIFMNHSLFEMISLVDTPGLNSITENHDRITEVCIREGHCFIFMAKLAEAAGHKDTERILSLIKETLDIAGISESQGSRVFCILNWYKNQVGSRTEAEAVKRIHEFEELASKYINVDELKVYVVELSPEALRSPLVGCLLGRPSLNTLLKDLKKFIVDKGLEDRFKILHQRLHNVWQGWERDISRQEHQLNGETSSKKDKIKLQNTLNCFKKNSKYIEDLEAQISKKIFNLLFIFDNIEKRLGQINKKQEFENFLASGPNMMRIFNRERRVLADTFSKEISSSINGKTRNLLFTKAMISPCKKQLNNVEPLPASSFKEFIKEDLDKWPGFYVPIIYNPGSNRRKKYKKMYFSDEIRSDLEESLSNLSDAYKKELDRVRKANEHAILKRINEIGFSEKELESSKKILHDKKSTFNKFRKHVEWVLKKLKR